MDLGRMNGLTEISSCSPHSHTFLSHSQRGLSLPTETQMYSMLQAWVVSLSSQRGCVTNRDILQVLTDWLAWVTFKHSSRLLLVSATITYYRYTSRYFILTEKLISKHIMLLKHSQKRTDHSRIWSRPARCSGHWPNQWSQFRGVMWHKILQLWLLRRRCVCSFMIRRCLEHQQLLNAVINIPVNATMVPLLPRSQPPWSVWWLPQITYSMLKTQE